MKIGAVALFLSALALGAAIFTLTREAPKPERTTTRTNRVAALERRVEELTREVDLLKLERHARAARTPSLSIPGTTRTETGDGSPEATASNNGGLEAIVDDAVDRKTKRVLDEMRIKANKKPAWGIFASQLELTGEQRAAAERVIVDGQRRVHELLDTPTANGTNLMNELIDIFAKKIAQPNKDHGFTPWIGRIISEKVPGTDVTYATRLEAVKSEMRASFKRDWTPAQYREFEEWGVDPTEVQKVPGSPNEGLEARIVDRARRYGADIPNEEKKGD